MYETLFQKQCLGCKLLPKPVTQYSTQEIEREDLKSPQTLEFTGLLKVLNNVDNVDNVWKRAEIQGFLRIKKSTLQWDKINHYNVDNVDNYLPKSDSPISTTFPAPIVINKSPVEQFNKINVSISSKVGKYCAGVPSFSILSAISRELTPKVSVSRAA